jgi:hypothetical protein
MINLSDHSDLIEEIVITILSLSLMNFDHLQKATAPGALGKGNI